MPLSNQLIRIGRAIACEEADAAAVSLAEVDALCEALEVYKPERNHVALVAVAWSMLNERDSEDCELSVRHLMMQTFGEEHALMNLRALNHLVDSGVFYAKSGHAKWMMNKDIGISEDFESDLEEAELSGKLRPPIVFETNEDLVEAYINFGRTVDMDLSMITSDERQQSTMNQILNREARSEDHPFKLFLAQVDASLDERMAICHLAYADTKDKLMSVHELQKCVGYYRRHDSREKKVSVEITLIAKGLAQLLTDQHLRTHSTAVVLTDIVRDAMHLDDPQQAINQSRYHTSGGTSLMVVNPTRGLSALIVEPKVRDLLQGAVERFRRNIISKLLEWGVQQPGYTQPNEDRLVVALYGPPGTGKTMAAFAMAKELEREVVTVDPSSFLGSFVGDSELQLREVFARMRYLRTRMKTPPVLVINEADAVLHQRIRADHSADHMHNNLVAILLDEVERYQGLLILTVNDASRMDEAFSRRLDLKICFNRPNTDLREQLWKLYLPDTIPGANAIDKRILADRCELSGGQICTIVANACAEVALREPANQLLSVTDLERFIELERRGQFETGVNTNPIGFLNN